MILKFLENLAFYYILWISTPLNFAFETVNMCIINSTIEALIYTKFIIILDLHVAVKAAELCNKLVNLWHLLNSWTRPIVTVYG